MHFRTRFAMWLVAFLGVFLVANLPRDYGVLKDYLIEAGFPFLFARWESRELTEFSFWHLALDMAIAITTSGLVSFLLTWPYRKRGIGQK